MKWLATLAKAFADIDALRVELLEERRARKAEAEALARARRELDAMRAWGGMRAYNGSMSGEVKPRDGQTMFDAILERQKALRGADDFGSRQKRFQTENIYVPGQVKWSEDE